MKIPRAQEARLLPVELSQPREQHRADRHVHPHAQRVRAASDLEQVLLRELLTAANEL
jgi:ribosomal protein S7